MHIAEIYTSVIVLLVLGQVGLSEFDFDSDSEDESCPRNRKEAEAKGHKCLRKCKNDSDCISARKRCLCDGQCGWSCVRPDLHCGELPPLDNGRITMTGDHFGAKATFTCNEGYWIFGSRERICHGNGNWSGTDTMCKDKGITMCGLPPKVIHARHNAPLDKEEFETDSVLQYNCFPGYDSKGFTRAKCFLYNGLPKWFGPEIVCIPRSCGPPGEIEKGHREGEVFTFTSRVTYHCIEGYELVGRASRYCQSNGKWDSVLPTCQPVQCAIPEDPPNGRALYTSIFYNSVVKYECRYRYKLVGPATKRCGTSKQWEGGESYCEEIDCGPSGVLHNGYLEGRSTTLGSVIFFRCFDGMKFEGASVSTTCLEGGVWSNPMPKCLAPCIVPEVENGLVNEVQPGSRVTHGQKIMVDCNTKYELVYNATPATCDNGTWSHVPTCVPARCKQLPPRPRNGMLIAPKTDHGMKALFRCNDGYILDGSNVTSCHFGIWTGRTPVCKEIYCPFPGWLEHGSVLLVGHMGMYEYRPYVRKVRNNRQIMYECKRHYTLIQGPSGATCVDGQWSPKQLPRCVRGKHPQVRWNRSVRQRREAAIRRQRRRELGRRRRGKNPRMKEKKVKAPCEIPATQNGVYHHFQLAVPEGSPIRHGEVVTLTCVPGFQLMGPESLRCWYGEWSVDNPPECVPRPCELPLVSNGHYLSGYRAGLTISHSSYVDFQCNPDYVKTSTEAIRCSEGQLQPMPPGCQHHSLRFVTVPGSDGVQETEVRYRQPEGNEISVIDIAVGGGRRSCGPPERQQNTLLYPAGRGVVPPVTLRDEESMPTKVPNLQSGRHSFPHGTEVRFKCITGITGEKTTWKIVCEDGNWVGGAYKCETEQEAPPAEDRRNKSCTFRNTEPHLVAFHGDKRITDEVAEFPPATELVFRCRDIGKFSLIGSVRRRCVHGDWDGVKPACFGLSQENDYALEKPPTILFRHQLGPIVQSNDGKLIVYPGTILHLECLWIRKYGTPKWEISHSYRRYAEGWTNEPGRDPQLEYRLSIYHAQKDDSGRFTCLTPMGHRHYVDIVVAAIHCPLIEDIPGLHISNPNTKMETKVVFSCKDGQTLIGSEQATCLPSGNWSAKPPTCQGSTRSRLVMECPDISNSTDPRLRISMGGQNVRAKTTFTCDSGYGLRGDDELTCLDTGQWSGPVPYCEEVVCESPDAPEHGYLQGKNRDTYQGRDVIQFACNTGYMMEGTAIIVCQDSGRWSGSIPKCVPACTYPGTTQGATISIVKFYYGINETVTFECSQGAELRGAKMLRCLEDGRWSTTIPTCHPSRKG